MSVVNQMLKDLELRRAQGPASGAAALEDLRWSPAKTRRARGRRLLWTAIALLAILSALALWWRWPAPAISLPRADNAAVAAAAPTADPVPERALVEPPAAPASMMRARPAQQAPASEATETPPAAAPTVPESAPADTPPREFTASVPLEPRAASAAAEPAAEPDRPPPEATPTVEKQVREPSAGQRAQQAYARGIERMRAGDTDAAAENWRAALDSDATHLAAREALAALLLNRRQIDAAHDLLASGLESAPRHVPFARLYARILVERGDDAAATAVLERAQPALEADPDYHAFLAAVYQRLGRHSQALEKYRAVLRLRPGAGAWWMGAAISLEATGARGEALDAYRRARASGALGGESVAYVEARIAVLAAGGN